MAQMIKVVKNEVIDQSEQQERLSENMNNKVKILNNKIDFVTKALFKIANHHNIELLEESEKREME